VAKQGVSLGSIERLVEHMFDQVFSEAERAELLVWIHEWEAAHPDADAAHRVTGWIDVAYSFQARPHAKPAATRRPSTTGGRADSSMSPVCA